MTSDDLVTRLLPLLGRSLAAGFNVFDVMHHGTHEKQLSNVFSWLLDVGGTHHFEGLGQRLFVELVNGARGSDQTLPLGRYTVRQEVNTAQNGYGADIADIVLENTTAVIVVENYETSDGHGHGYANYLRFGQRTGRIACVVLLCAEEDRHRLTDGWEDAVVVTYEVFLNRLVAELGRDPRYAAQNPEQHGFITQLHRKFATGRTRMSNKEALDFIAAMCMSGEAGRYQDKKQDVAAEQFASEVATRARERFTDGRVVLQAVKAQLRSYGATVLAGQVNATLGPGFIRAVSARFSGIYQWTINFDTAEQHDSLGEARLQIKFGPSAWFAIEQDRHWQSVPEDADYSRLFLTREHRREVRQSTVSLHEVLEGLAPTDTRLHDEIIDLIRAT